MRLRRGIIVLVTLDPALGHEQRGVGPCVIVTDPEVTEDQHYPMVCMVPITKTPGEGALYPSLAAGTSGLRASSHVLVDQIRAIDKRRITRILGSISGEELTAIDDGLRLFLGLT